MRWLQLLIAMIELPADPGEQRFFSRLARLQLAYSLAGLTLGLICVVGGCLLFFHGVSGSSSWVGDFIGVHSWLSDAAPGTVLFVVGLLVVWITRFEIRVRGRGGRSAGAARPADSARSRRKAS
ncbi:MAG TPA: hypothetical protein VET65_07325 [Candidatus Limnocylindrales bacterium]|nr:hypothetical protein [Candidatus Limnocylindrales bacterium]